MLKVDLTPEMQSLIDAYDGDLEAAAQKSGVPLNMAQAFVKLPFVRDALRAVELRDYKKRQKIATREDRQKLWSWIMDNFAHSPDIRMRASELLAKSEGDFVTRTIHENPDGTPIATGTQIQIMQIDMDDRTKLMAAKIRPAVDFLNLLN